MFSLLLAIYTGVTTRVHFIHASEWGLVSELPASFWLGLVLLIVLIFFSRDSNVYMTVALALTLIYLYGIPTLLEEFARTPWAYYPAVEASQLARKGCLIPNKEFFINYHSWPLFLYLLAIIILISNMDPFFIYKYFPLLIILFYSILIFLLLKNKFNTSESLQGVIWFLSSFWVHQNYFGGQGISFIFYLTIVLILSWYYITKRKRKPALVLLFIFFFISATFTNPLTSLMIWFGILCIYIFHRNKSLFPINFNICILLGIFIFTYMLYFSYPLFKFALYKSLSEVTNIIEFSLKQIIRTRIVGSTEQLLSNFCRFSIVGINLLVLGVVIIRLLIKHKITRESYFFSWLLGFSSLILVTLYGTELIMRVYMFSLVPITYLIIKYFQKKRWSIFYIALMVVLILHIPAHYGGESFEMVTKMELSGSAFYAKYADSDKSYFINFLSSKVLWYFNQNLTKTKYSLIFYYEKQENMNLNSPLIKTSEYIIISETGKNYLVYYFGFDLLENINFNIYFSRIYDNSYYDVYKRS